MVSKNLIIIIDNYDSFTYNIYQMMGTLVNDDPDTELKVIRNDAVSVDDLKKMHPAKLIISPGPGTPSDAGISVEAIKTFAGEIPILGVCLGHQAIAEAFGGRIIQARAIVHGKSEEIRIDGKGVLRNLPNPCKFTRYHSLAAELESLPKDLEVTAWAGDGEIMGLRHKEWPVEGVQFHPESIGSDGGLRLLANFLNWRREPLDRPGLLNKVVGGGILTRNEASAFMDELTDGALEQAFIAAMLTAMAVRGPTPAELAGCASVLRNKCRQVHLDMAGVLDTCGTGGDGRHTFNISSLSALVAASAGAAVAKHGNRSVSSLSGSTEFYSELGIPVDLSPHQVEESVKKHGFAYMAAPLFHGAMRHAAPVRRAMGIKTIMNCIGPLSNPAGVDYQLIGVYAESLVPAMARAARALGVKRVMCVHSKDGLDEISPAAPTTMFFIDEDGQETESQFDPKNLDIKDIHTEDLVGGNAAGNARTAMQIIKGEGPAAVREAVCLNAGAALFTASHAGSIEEGYNMAKKALTEGKTEAKIREIVEAKK